MPLRYQIELPLPPSANRMWRKGRGRIYPSPQYEKWRKAADATFLFSGLNKGLKTIEGTYKLSISLPAKLRLDHDNLFKPIGDWLQRVKIVKNDKHCRYPNVCAYDAPAGYCIVTVEELSSRA